MTACMNYQKNVQGRDTYSALYAIYTPPIDVVIVAARSLST